jgi:predicted nucleotide-binding protein
MSIKENAQKAIKIIESQMTELREIDDRVSQDLNFKTASQRLDRWKSRTVNLLAENVSSAEGKGLQETRKTSFNIYQPLENIQDEIDMYGAFLQSLIEELNKHPEDVISLPAPSDEKAKIFQAPESESSKTVFVVHGRDDKLREAMFNLLRALGLKPLEWSQAIQATKKSSPYIGEILETAFRLAQAIIVLFSGDDEAKLREEFWGQNEPTYEKEVTPQSRPNVIFEAGMAMGGNESRTILVQVGKLRPISDIAGRHITHLDDSAPKRQELVTKLKGAGCEVNTSGTDWLTVGNFQK